MASRNPSRSSSTVPASSHTSDPILAPFLAPTFDPTAYLNSSLPPLGIATSQQPIIPSRHSSLPDLAAETQTQLAQLSAHETRLVSTLTTLTDEILRSGSRLAYEVELLRGEAVSLEEILATILAEDVKRFVPEKPPTPPLSEKDGEAEEALTAIEPTDGEDDMAAVATQVQSMSLNEQIDPPVDPFAPPALARLRTLQQVRNSLQSVISTFDAALSFPLPPSLLHQSTSAASFVSVAAPADPAQEAAGQEALPKLRSSIFDHLDTSKGGEGGADGALAADSRLEELRDLCKVWKGTSEEKARQKVLDGWERELEEAKDRLGFKGGLGPAGLDFSKEDTSKATDLSKDSGRSRGLFGGLRRLGDKIYLE